MIGWVAWALLAFFAVGATGACYFYFTHGDFKHGGTVRIAYGTLSITAIWWLLLGWTFHYSQVSKLHLFWLAASAIPAASIVAFSLTSSVTGEPRLRPQVLPALLAGYVLILWWLTD